MSDGDNPAPRHRTLKGARLIFNNGHSAIDCLVRDISDTGARVSVENSVGVPDSVILLFDDGTSRACRVARRQLFELGLHFT